MRYAAHDFTLETPFPCPELVAASGEANIVVEPGQIRPPPFPWRAEGVCHKAAPGQYLLSVRSGADFLVTAGGNVRIEAAPGADLDTLRLFLYHEVIGAVLAQRGHLLLKGVVVARGDRAFAFLGASPSGKSMLAARLARRGFNIVADGFFSLTGDGKPRLQPGYPWLTLWEESVRTLGIAPETLKPVRPGLRRFYLPLGRPCRDQPAHLAAIHVLASHNRPEISIDEVAGADKLATLLYHRYHPELAAPLGMVAAQGRIAASLANSTTVSIVRHNDILVPGEVFADRMASALETQRS